VSSYLCLIASDIGFRKKNGVSILRCSGVFKNKKTTTTLLLDFKKSFSLLWQIEARSSFSTSSARTQFKLDGKRRKLDPNRPAPHTLRNRKTLTYLAIALIATVAAPQVINKTIDYYEKRGEKK